jgi:hypothetical protein
VARRRPRSRMPTRGKQRTEDRLSVGPQRLRRHRLRGSVSLLAFIGVDRRTGSDRLGRRRSVTRLTAIGQTLPYAAAPNCVAAVVTHGEFRTKPGPSDSFQIRARRQAFLDRLPTYSTSNMLCTS